MIHKEYTACTEHLVATAREIEEAKRPGYTQANPDVLHNFMMTAQLVGVRPLQVWGVFFLKHVQAVLAHAMNPEIQQGEPLLGRFADLLNYVKLGHAIFVEENETNVIRKSQFAVQA